MKWLFIISLHILCIYFATSAIHDPLHIFCGEDDCYELLGIERTTEAKDIKKAYRKMSLVYHPDKNKEADAAENFRKITKASEILSDDTQRELYDYYLNHPKEYYKVSGVYVYNSVPKTDIRYILSALVLLLSIFLPAIQYTRWKDMKRKMKNDILAMLGGRSNGSKQAVLLLLYNTVLDRYETRLSSLQDSNQNFKVTTKRTIPSGSSSSSSSGCGNVSANGSSNGSSWNRSNPKALKSLLQNKTFLNLLNEVIDEVVIEGNSRKPTIEDIFVVKLCYVYPKYLWNIACKEYKRRFYTFDKIDVDLAQEFSKYSLGGVWDALTEKEQEDVMVSSIWIGNNLKNYMLEREKKKIDEEMRYKKSTHPHASKSSGSNLRKIPINRTSTRGNAIAHECDHENEDEEVSDEDGDDDGDEDEDDDSGDCNYVLEGSKQPIPPIPPIPMPEREKEANMRNYFRNVMLLIKKIYRKRTVNDSLEQVGDTHSLGGAGYNDLFVNRNLNLLCTHLSISDMHILSSYLCIDIGNHISQTGIGNDVDDEEVGGEQQEKGEEEEEMTSDVEREENLANLARAVKTGSKITSVQLQGLDMISKKLHELNTIEIKSVNVLDTETSISERSEDQLHQTGNMKGSKVLKARDWTKEEFSYLSKAIAKYPAGTRHRWHAISNSMNEWIKPELPYTPEECTRSAHRAMEALAELKLKRSQANPNVPAVTAVKTENFNSSTNAIKTVDLECNHANVSVDDKSLWSQEQQKCLEEGLIRFPQSMEKKKRWQCVAECVSGKSVKECVDRYNYLRNEFRKKKLL